MKYKISEIGKVVGGGTPSTKHTEYYSKNGLAWITPKDLSDYHKKYIGHGTKDISEEGLKHSSAKLLPINSILISSRAPIGYVAMAGTDLATSQGFKSIIPDTTKILPDYLYYLMLRSKNKLERIASGSTFKEVSGREMSNFVVDIPELKIQKEIVQKLNPISKEIEKNNVINDNLLELMDSRFNHFISNSKLTDATLSDITDIHSGGNKPKEFSKVKTNKFCIPVYSNGVSNNGLYGFTNKAKVNERSVSISARGTIGFTVLHNEPFVPIVRLIYLTSKSVPINFLYLFVRSMNIQGYGSTQQQITVPYLKSLKIKVPDISEINKFDANNISAFDLILENKKENILLSDIKETLLNKYF